MQQTLAETLRELMNEQDLTAVALAEKIGVSHSGISKFLRKEQLPRLVILVKLADYFAVTTDFLLGLSEESDASSFASPPPFSTQFNRLLRRFSTSKYRLKKQLGFAEITLTGWQRGSFLPSAENLIRLAAFFDCSVDFVIGREL